MRVLGLERTEWRLLLLLLVCYVYFLPRFADWSQSSRTALILALVNEWRLEIDTYAALTGDYAELNGHRYSDKAPGPALLGAPVYAVTKRLLASPGGERLIERVAQGEGLRETLKPGVAARDKLEFALAQTVATWAVVSAPAAILGVLIYRLVQHISGSQPTALIVALALGLATSSFPYAGALYSHQLVAALAFAAFFMLWKKRDASPARLLCVGLLLGLALISEYPVALIAGGLGLYALVTTRRVITAFHIGIGTLLALALMAVHNFLIFSTPLPVGYSYSTLWQTEHQTGFFSLSVPTWDAFWGITFGAYRGLFYVSPVLLLGVVGLGLLVTRRTVRAEGILAAWCVLSFIAFNSSSVMWTGGFAVGPRYLVPMLPFLALGIGAALDQWGRVASFRILTAVLIAWSAFATWSLTIGGQSFPGFDPEPLWHLALPALLQGDVARNVGTLAGLKGWWSVLPLAVVVLSLLLSTLRSLSSAHGGAVREGATSRANVEPLAAGV